MERPESEGAGVLDRWVGSAGAGGSASAVEPRVEASCGELAAASVGGASMARNILKPSKGAFKNATSASTRKRGSAKQRASISLTVVDVDLGEDEADGKGTVEYIFVSAASLAEDTSSAARLLSRSSSVVFSGNGSSTDASSAYASSIRSDGEAVVSWTIV